MANIPGVSGYIQPGVFARDRVVSRGVSLPGGVRIVSILGEGSREVTLVESALGSGQDGVQSPDGEVNGRFFRLPLAPVISGRTELRLNDSLLFGKQEKISGTLDSRYDYRIDIETGYIELRAANFKDIDGKDFSTGDNVGLGTISELILMSEDASAEKYTLRCSTVIRDSNGTPVPGKSKFTLVGSESGVSRDENGNQILFSDTYKSGSATINRNNSLMGGLVLASTDETGIFSRAFEASAAELVDADGNAITSGETIYLKVTDNLGLDTVSQADDEPLSDRILVGDSLVISGIEYKVEAVKSDVGFTTLTLNRPVAYDVTVTGATVSSWSIRAFDAITFAATTVDGSDIGKIVIIDGGEPEGVYQIHSVQSDFGIVRVYDYNEGEGVSFPNISSDTTTNLSLLETDGVIALGISSNENVSFDIGDKFMFEVDSLSLSENDRLEARFIYELDVNDPEFFISATDLADKHGFSSLENNLSLGARLAFENGAPGVLALQTKPALPRRTSVVLLEEQDGNGIGGFKGSVISPEADDLTFEIPIPTDSGIREGRPNADTQVNIFVIRDGKETQIFPNKVGFYNSQFEDESGRENFVTGSDNDYAYTVANYDAEVIFSGTNALLNVDSDSQSRGIFFASGANFDGSHVGKTIVLKSGVDGSTLISDSDDIGTHLFAANHTHELEIVSVIDDETVSVKNSVSGSENFTGTLEDVQFLVKDESSSAETAVLLLHSDIVTSGSIKTGDGIKVSYVDNNDSDFYDTNYFNAFEKLEAFDAQIIVPLPKENKSAIFQAAVRHCELMSSITKRRERVAFIGAFQGLTVDAIVGRELVAVEDVGVVEGIQGDDPEEVLNQNIEDLQNYKLSDNFSSNKCVYFYPEQIVRNIQGQNTFVDGFYMAAAAAGYLSGTQNVAIPLTNKNLIGFTILRDRVFRDITLNELGSEGATVVQPIVGGGKVLAGRTTSQSGFVEDEEISIIFIRNKVKDVLRTALADYVGRVQDDNTNVAISVKVKSIMSALINQKVIESYGNVKVERDKVDPRQINVLLRFVPVYPINYIFIDIEVGL